MGLTADHMLEFATPFHLAFARVGLPDPQREKLILGQTRSFIHQVFSSHRFVICTHVHQDNQAGASKALHEQITKVAV
jgi:hypothetical protein